MTHFGIICPAAVGHLNPMTTLGYELQQRGHQVTVINIEDARDRAEAAGLEFQAIAQTEYPQGHTKEIFNKLGSLKGIRAMKFTVDAIVNGARVFLTYAPEVIKNRKIDALLIDQAACEGGTIAEHLKIPFVSVCSAIMLNEEISVPPCITDWNYDVSWPGIIRNRIGYAALRFGRKPLLNTINRYRRQWNLRPLLHIDEAYSQLAQICQQPREFEFPRQELPTVFHFTGSFNTSQSRKLIPFPYEKLTDQPLIYASLGTVQNRSLWIFKRIIEACRELDVQLVIALGSGLSPESLASSIAGNNAIVVDYAPQLELLQKAELTITHAGMNTALESLSHGVPMIAIPIINDQPGVAARITWTGTGEKISPSMVSVEKLQSTIQQVLTNDSYKQNAIKLQQAIQQAGGQKKAADIIEEVINHKNR